MQALEIVIKIASVIVEAALIFLLVKYLRRK